MNTAMISFLKALADPTRIRISLLLKRYELTVSEICSILEMGQSRISRHLKILLDTGILECRREGLFSYYSVNVIGSEAECLDALFPFLQKEQEYADYDLAESVLNKRSERTRDFFNTIAGRWDHLKKDIFGTLDINSVIMKYVRDCGCSTVVDLGCGTGDLIASILEQDKFHADMIGVDNSPAMIEQAKRRFEDLRIKPELRIGSIEHLPMRDNEVDCALLNCVLHHSPKPSETIREINRAVRMHKSFILVEFDRHDITAFSSEYGDLWLGFEKQTLFNWLDEGGFEVKHYDAVNIESGMVLHIIISEKVRGMHDFEATA